MNVEGRVVKGYAATWDVDSIGDQIVRGAFADTIAERGPRLVNGETRSKIKVFYNHSLCIGRPLLMREDEKGLYVEFYVDETDLGNMVLAMIESGTLDVMSFAFDVVEAKPVNGLRRLLKLKVYELGPVDIACNEEASIIGIKSSDFDSEDGEWDSDDGEWENGDDEWEEDGESDVNDVDKSISRVLALFEQLEEAS